MPANRNADLEQSIQNDPDNPDGYYVYGDWLSGRGDPRGELIALQGALLRSPGDKTLKAATNKILKSKRKQLLGDLADLKPTELIVTWHLGFIRDARIHVKDAKKRKAALKALLNNPSGAFLQSLAIAQAVVSEPLKLADYTGILLKEKKPATLQDLVIGNPGSFDATADKHFMKTFPRLRKSLDKTWDAILATIDEQSRLTMKYNVKAFPRLETNPDLPTLPKISKEQILKGLKLELDKKRNLGLFAALKRTYTVESLDKWGVAFGEEFWRLEQKSGQRWGFVAMGLLGHQKTVDWIGRGIRHWTYGRAEQGVELLRELGINEALFELYSLSVSESDRRNVRAREALDHTAGERGVPVEDLIDKTIPFHPTGSFKKQVQKALEHRFVDFLLNGHKFTVGDFGRYVTGHPMCLPLAQRLVWGAYKKDTLRTTFRITKDAKIVGRDKKPVDVDGFTLGVAHPIEIPNAQRQEITQAWSKALKQAKVKPLCPQLERPCRTLPAAEQKGSRLTRFEGRRVGYRQLEDVLGKRGWWNRHEWEEGTHFTKSFFRDNIYLHMLVGDDAKVERVEIRSLASGSRKLSNLHPVTLSEILDDLETATQDNTERVESAEANGKTIEKGMKVRIKSGTRKRGTVFWIGKDKRTGNARAGVKTKAGETIWADLKALVPIEETTKKKTTKKATTKKAAPTKKKTTKKTTAAKKKATKKKRKPTSGLPLAKGVTVKYSVKGTKGTGFVFWVGANKYGPGQRAGIKDNKTGETIWAAESELTVTKAPDP